MNTFQIISVIISILFILSAIVGFYIKNLIAIKKIETDCKVAIGKIEVEIELIKEGNLKKEIIAQVYEKNNREDHQNIGIKLDKILERI